MVTILAPSRSMVKYKGIKWWAEKGMICSEDDRPGDLRDKQNRAGAYKMHTVRDILRRLRAINDMIGNSRKNNAYRPDEINAERDYVDNMVELCKVAQAQGRPELTKARAQIREESRKARIVVPGISF
jgi:hypothetical protein